MHGNVCEWVLDWSASYSSGSVTEPSGASSGSSRVMRGGSWNDYANCCRSAIRFNYYPSSPGKEYGFRLCCSAEPSGK